MPSSNGCLHQPFHSIHHVFHFSSKTPLLWLSMQLHTGNMLKPFHSFQVLITSSISISFLKFMLGMHSSFIPRYFQFHHTAFPPIKDISFDCRTAHPLAVPVFSVLCLCSTFLVTIAHCLYNTLEPFKQVCPSPN